MAMPTDFWRNDQMLNIFRTKPCQRLARDGVCGWRSQCQFSHDLSWPRRQPRRYNYSPELCPNIKIVEDSEGGTQRIENTCTAGLRCPWAHSKEEVLFHPHIFKTTLCEEHTNNAGSKEKTRNAKKNRCHRYYCPFAHGNDEIRTSPLSAEQRERCIRAMETLPSDVCCVVCTRHWVTPQVGAEQKDEPTSPFGSPFDAPSPFLMPGKGPMAPGLGPNGYHDVLSTVPNLRMGGPPKDIFAGNHFSKELKDIFASKELNPFLEKPDPFAVPGLIGQRDSPSSFFAGPHPLSSLAGLSSESPAFIDFTSSGCSVGQRQSTKSSAPQDAQSQRDLLGEFYYAML